MHYFGAERASLGHYRWEVTEIVIVDVLGVIGKATYDKQNL